MKRSLSTLLLAMLLAGCASEEGIVDKGAYELDTRHQAQAAYPRIKVLVIHYTADDFDTSLATLTDKNVSSHYLIPAKPPAPQGKPRIWQLVPESELAWHAGISFWRGTNRINDTSVGIELENRGWREQRRNPLGPFLLTHCCWFPVWCWQQGIGAWPDPGRVNFLSTGDRVISRLIPPALLDLLARYS